MSISPPSHRTILPPSTHTTTTPTSHSSHTPRAPRALNDPRTLRPRLAPQMPIQRVHPRKRLPTPLALERAEIAVQLFMSLTIVLPCETLAAPRPVALVRLLFVVRAQVPLEVEPPRERRAAAGNRAREVRVLLPPPDRRVLRPSSGDVLLRDRAPWSPIRTAPDGPRTAPPPALRRPRVPAVDIRAPPSNPHFLIIPRTHRRLPNLTQPKPTPTRTRNAHTHPIPAPRHEARAQLVLLELAIAHARARIRTGVRAGAAYMRREPAAAGRRPRRAPHLRAAVRARAARRTAEVAHADLPAHPHRHRAEPNAQPARRERLPDRRQRALRAGATPARAGSAAGGGSHRRSRRRSQSHWRTRWR